VGAQKCVNPKWQIKNELIFLTGGWLYSQAKFFSFLHRLGSNGPNTAKKEKKKKEGGKITSE
jgi:hypothetical protein